MTKKQLRQLVRNFDELGQAERRHDAYDLSEFRKSEERTHLTRLEAVSRRCVENHGHDIDQDEGDVQAERSSQIVAQDKRTLPY